MRSFRHLSLWLEDEFDDEAPRTKVFLNSHYASELRITNAKTRKEIVNLDSASITFCHSCIDIWGLVRQPERDTGNETAYVSKTFRLFTENIKKKKVMLLSKQK